MSVSYRQFSDGISRVAGLHLILDDVAQNLSGRQLSEKQRSELSTLREGPRIVLEELGFVLENFSGLGKEQPTIRAKARKAWKQLRWDQDAIGDFRSRIISNTMLLQAFNFRLISESSQTMTEDMAAISEQVGGLQLNNDQNERRKVLDWITPLNFPAQQSALLSRRQEGTGQWLFESPEFNTWMNKPGETLLCKGIPGAGKTMLASIAIDHLKNALSHKNTPVVYIYCDYKRQQEQTPINLMASILKQLLQIRVTVPDYVMNSYHHHINSGTRQNSQEIGGIVKSLLGELPQAYIVVDALDELPVSGQVCQILLADLRSLQKVQSLNLMITSRPIPLIDHQLQHALFLEIRASNEDIKKYVYGRMSDLAISAQNDPILQEAIANSIVDIVDGMFLLAHLHMDSLTDKTNTKALKKALEKLPMGSDALDLAYDQAMQRIQNQKPGFRNLAERALSWITYAYRLLTATELCYALAIEVGETEFDEENLDDIESILLVCCGLMTVDPQTETVRLAHYTTQDYFKKIGSRHFPSAREDIAVSCLTYLLFDEFGEGWVPYDNDTAGGCVVMEPRFKEHHVLRYAAQFWARHAEDCYTSFDDRVGKLLIDFIKNDNKVSSVAQTVLQKESDFNLYCSTALSATSAPVSGIHLAAYASSVEIVSYLLEAGLFAADVKDQVGRTPLIWAAKEGHEALVKWLLHRQDVDVNAVELRGEGHFPITALAWAASNGHAGTVELLLERDDIDVNLAHPERADTALIWAAKIGQEATIKALLKHQDIVADHEPSDRRTALYWAAARGDAGSVQILLKRNDVNADRKDDEGKTSLAIATYCKRLEVVKLLLKCKDVDPNSRNNDGETVLQLASWLAKEDPRPGRQEILELIRSAIQVRSGITQEHRPVEE